MKKILLMLFGAACLTASAQVYQIGNSDFETDWADNNEPGNGWYSFSSAGGKLSSMKSFSKSTLTKVTGENAHGGSGTSVLLQSISIIEVKANGNMTTGQINMGAKKPESESNYNHTARGSYATQLAGTPDSIAFYGKFSRSSKTGTYTGRLNAIIHGDIDYKDPYETDANAAAYKIAQATVYSTVTDTWTRYCGPFTYTGVTGSTMYILASFTTNETPGGSSGDKFYIDDVSLIYNSEMVSFVYDGTTYTAASDLSAVAYDATKMGAITTNGKGATTTTAYDEATGTLTITVKGNDISVNASNYHTYTLQFAKPATKTTYSGGLVVIINGSGTEPQATDIYMTEETDGTYTLSLNNFMLGEGDEAIPVGNIVLSGLTKQTAADGTETITSNQTITIAVGDNPDVGEDNWLGPMLGEVPIEFSAVIEGEELFCNIDIDMEEMLGQYINVAFAPNAAVVGELAVPTATGEKNVILSRAFSAGWNTICLPFAFTPSEVADGAVAQAFTSVTDGALGFSAVTSCEANTPYLFYVPAAVQYGKIFRHKTVAEATAKSVTNGAFSFTGVYTDEDGMSMAGKYGVATVDGVQKIRLGGANSNIFGTRAYFTTTDADANGMQIRLNDGTSTGITSATTTTGTTGVYNLQGVRMGTTLSTLPAGVYIVNGKKVIK